VPSALRKYWRQPGYWRWWWQDRVSGEAKVAAVVLLAAAMALAGFEAASKLVPKEPATAAFVTKRIVTRPTKNGARVLVTEVRTVTGPGENQVTVTNTVTVTTEVTTTETVTETRGK